MYTNLYIIDAFRELIRQTSDDSVFSDELLFHYLNIVRVRLMRQYLNDNKNISPWMYQRFCIKLCPSTFMECNCEPFKFACTVWRSENPIPRPMLTNSGNIINVSELYGSLITPVTENSSRFLEFRKHKRVFHYLIGDVRGEKYMFIITNTKPPKYIKAEMILEDPSQILYNQCEDEPCEDIRLLPFPIETHLLDSLYKLTLELMSVAMSTTDDRSNNSEGIFKPVKNARREEE